MRIDTTSLIMYEFCSTGLICHHSCLEFGMNFLQLHLEIQSLADYRFFRKTSHVNTSGNFFVSIMRAVDLPKVQYVGRQSPYVKCWLNPWNESVQTKCAIQGGKNPIWQEDSQEYAFELFHPYNSDKTPMPTLAFEIWNANYFSEDLLGTQVIDLEPLMRHPQAKTTQWFPLEDTNQGGRILLSIMFQPMEINASQHKFRIHSIKSSGMKLLKCAVCDKLIVGLRAGYRCQICGLDVHQNCMLRGSAKFQCQLQASNSPSEHRLLPRTKSNVVNSPTKRTNSSASSTLSTTSLKPHQDQLSPAQTNKSLARSVSTTAVVSSPVHIDEESTIADPSSVTSTSSTIIPPSQSLHRHSDPSSCGYGQLYVYIESLHLCHRGCQLHQHPTNPNGGDTYCRLHFADTVHETKVVYKTGDPVIKEEVYYSVFDRSATLVIEVVDLKTNHVLANKSWSLFQLLQHDADQAVHSISSLNLGRVFGINQDDELVDFPLLHPKTTHQPNGQVKIRIRYIETKRNIFLPPPTLHDREEKELSQKQLKMNFERMQRLYQVYLHIERQYLDLIAWKDRRHTLMIFLIFVYLCLFYDAEYCLALVFYAGMIFLIISFIERVNGTFVLKLIQRDTAEDFAEYEIPYRPVGILRLAPIEAQLEFEDTSPSVKARKKSSAVSSSSLYIRMKYMPHDSTPPSNRHTGSSVNWISTGAQEGYDIGRSHAVRQVRLKYMNSSDNMRTLTNLV